MNWIVFVLILFIGFIILFAISISKQKKGEILLIDINDDKIKFYLGDDEYLSFDISDIKEKEKIYEKIKEVIKSRSFELKDLVYKVQFFDNGDKEMEEKLLKLLVNE